MLKTLQTALANRRVTARTANKMHIAKAVALGLLTEGELAGVYVLTAHGRCVAGDPPF